MNYVEWLRVRNVTRLLGIVLGCFLVVAVIVRIAIAVQFSSDQALISHLNNEPGTVITHSVVNGMSRTTIVNPREHVKVTIDDRSDGGKLITVVAPRGRKSDSNNITVGSVGIITTTGPETSTTVIDTDEPVSAAYYLAAAFLAAMIVATILGASFARENDGHLEFALLKPVSRNRYALGVIGVDFIGLLICEALTIVACIACQAVFEVPHVDLSGLQLPYLLLVVLTPFSWYAFLNAATASLKRGAGAVVGFAWPVSAVIAVLGQIDFGPSMIAKAFHAIFWCASSIIPLSYGSFHFSGNQMHASLTLGESFPVAVLMTAILLLVYGALTVVQWRRVEA